MLQKNGFKRSESTKQAFEKLRIEMTQALVLALLDFSQVFIIECDASESSIRAILQ